MKKRNRGRPIGSTNKKISITLDTRKKVKMICNKCKKKWSITTTNLEMYTDELKKVWICPVCK